MDTDRPNVTNTPHTIDAGHWQMETGAVDYTYDRDDVSGAEVRSDDIAFGQFNFRIGVLDNLELNAVVDAFEADRIEVIPGGTQSDSSGFGDTTIGGKLNLWGNEGGDETGYTALAIQPQLKFPTARKGVGNGHFEFAVAAPFLANLPGGFHLGLQAGVSYERNSSDTGYVAGLPAAVSVDRVVPGNLDIYLEYASYLTAERHALVPQTIDVGGTYPLTKNIMLDAGVAIGLNSASNDVEVLTGISFRR